MLYKKIFNWSSTSFLDALTKALTTSKKPPSNFSSHAHTMGTAGTPQEPK
jgi:hypothetical protein